MARRLLKLDAASKEPVAVPLPLKPVGEAGTEAGVKENFWGSFTMPGTFA